MLVPIFFANVVNESPVTVALMASCHYKNAPAGTREDIKKKYQNNKLNLQGSIQNAIAAAYRKENPKITHFYNNINYNEVPIWAIFEIECFSYYHSSRFVFSAGHLEKCHIMLAYFTYV